MYTGIQTISHEHRFTKQTCSRMYLSLIGPLKSGSWVRVLPPKINENSI